MIVLDTSALLAVLLLEPEAEQFASAIAEADARCISTVSLLETSLVLASRHGEMALRELDDVIRSVAITPMDFTVEQMMIAREAFLRYGKGRHAAGLNFGDCASYALAKANDAPLLFKGGDFAATDVLPAIARRT